MTQSVTKRLMTEDRMDAKVASATAPAVAAAIAAAAAAAASAADAAEADAAAYAVPDAATAAIVSNPVTATDTFLNSTYGTTTRTLDLIDLYLSLIHISEPTRQAEISYAVF